MNLSLFRSDDTEPVASDTTIADLFAALDNARRREMVRLLADANRQVAFNTVVLNVAAAENDVPAGKVTSDQRKCVYTATLQNHAPTLDDLGLIDYAGSNRSRGAFHPTEATLAAARVLELADDVTAGGSADAD